MSSTSPAAIIGLAAAMPRAADLPRFWGRLLHNVDCLEVVPADRWDRAAHYNPDPASNETSYAERGGFLPEVAFDPLAYGLPPHILPAIDSGQLIALRVADAALEDAGHPPGGVDHERTAVILGIAGTTMKLLHQLAARLELKQWRHLLAAEGLAPERIQRLMAAAEAAYPAWSEDSFPGFLANVVAGRIAQRFGLGGITMALDAACASALVALAAAQAELALGRADLVLTGGVDVDNSLTAFLSFSKTPALSRSGRIHPFDEEADGTLVSEGVGMMVLKPLDAAERAGDRIYAILRGVGTASDGRAKSIYAPSAAGQRRALDRAYAAAEVEPSSVGLIEAHATGTAVGDAVELECLEGFFGAAGATPGSIALGAAKGLVGHTKAAAGAVGVIKAALALHHRVLPPSPAPERPVAALGRPDIPFKLLECRQPWMTKEPRRAGVSAFGFGGADAHAILEEVPTNGLPAPLAPHPRGLLFDALDPARLKETLATTAERLAGREGDSTFAALARHSETRPVDPVHPRLGLMAADAEEALVALSLANERLETDDAGPWSLPAGVHYAPRADARAGEVVAVFPGQGAQTVGMAAEAAAAFPQLRAEIEGMAEVLAADGVGDLVERLWARTGPATSDAADRLAATLYAQTALGGVSAGLLRVLEAAGLKVDFCLGHSFGELPALLAAGVLAPVDYRRLVVVRGRALTVPAGTEAGAMIAVQASAEQIVRLDPPLPSAVRIANDNSPRQAVLGGPVAAIAAAADRLRARGINVVELPVSAAFHTELIAGGLGGWSETVAEVAVAAPSCPVFATADGAAYPAEGDAIRRVLEVQPRRPVRFREQIEAAWAAGGRVFVEIGPRATMTRLIGEILAGRPHHAVAVLPAVARDSERQLRHAVLRLRVLGLPLREPEPLAPPPKPEAWTASAVPVSGALVGARERMGRATRMRESIAAERREGGGARASLALRSETRPHQHAQAAPGSVPALHSRDEDAAADLVFHFERERANIAAHAEFLKLAREQTAVASDLLSAGRTELADRMLAQASDIAALHRRWVEASSGPAPPAGDVPTPAHEASLTRDESEAGLPLDRLATEALTVPDAAEVEGWLVEIVAEQTGYPKGFLSNAMDLEADLGIDSIKLVELIAALRARLVRACGARFEAPDAIPREELVRLRSIGAIAGRLAEFIAGRSGDAGPEEARSEARGPEPPDGPVGPTPSSRGPQRLEAGETLRLLTEALSDVTGYPIGMLTPDLELEADLGIDSTRRVEILERVQQQLEPHGSTTCPDLHELAAARTLDDVCELFVSLAASSDMARMHAGLDASLADLASAGLPVDGAAARPPLMRTVLEPVQLDPPPSDRPVDRPVLLVADRSPLAGRLVAGLASAGHRCFVLALPGEDALDPSIDCLALESTTDEGVSCSLERAIRFAGNPGNILICLPSASGRPGLAASSALLAALARQYQDRRGTAGAPVTLARVCLGGNSGASLPDPLTGLAGLARTAAREWPGVPVTAVSIETSSGDIEGVAARVLEVLAAAPGGVLAYRDETWWRVDVEPFGALPEPAAPDALAGPDGATVIWATGGLRGITATAALALARRCGNARAILIGRPVAPEPDWARGVADRPLVTAAVAALGAEATPQAVRTVVADIRRARAEAATLAAFSEAGIPARALHVNIVDRNAVARVVEMLEPRLRQPDVLIHGAGARADRRLADKRADDFETVWRPKVDGLTALLDPSVLPDTPRRLLLFASTAGTFGNPGQADYAAANEVLVAAAESLRRQDEHCRATAIAWGPWAAGMVDAEGLARFKKRGVAVIEPDEGASLFADLAFADPGPVIIAGSDPAPAPTLGSVRFAPATEPVLTEHRLNGRPVLPAAWAAARLARLAGTLELVGFEVDAGLPLDTVAGAVVTVRREGARWRLEHGSTLAFVAEAVRSPTAQEPVAAPMPGLDEGRSLDPRGYLEGPLQYGPSFRRVEAAWRTAEGEVSLKLGPLPVLPGWQGAINPLLYDIATHGVLIHALERSSDSCLPRRVARIVWVRPVPTGVPLSVRTRFVLDTPKNIVADIDAFDADGMLLLRLEGFEALRRPASLTRGVMLREGERTSVPAGSAG